MSNNNSDSGLIEDFGFSKIFLISFPKSVPPGSLEKKVSILLFLKYFFNLAIKDDLPEPSMPSKVMNIIS